MAKRKKPESETFEEAKTRQAFEQIANKATRSEKMSWDRKKDNMIKLIATIRPLEDKILDLMAKKTKIADDVQALRNDMVKECIHPFEYLVKKDTHIECKFCYKKISFPRKTHNDNKTDN